MCFACIEGIAALTVSGLNRTRFKPWLNYLTRVDSMKRDALHLLVLGMGLEVRMKSHPAGQKESLALLSSILIAVCPGAGSKKPHKRKRSPFYASKRRLVEIWKPDSPQNIRDQSFLLSPA